jgi:hypothetical protein
MIVVLLQFVFELWIFFYIKVEKNLAWNPKKTFSGWFRFFPAKPQQS